jgi:hypothetical protein
MTVHQLPIAKKEATPFDPPFVVPAVEARFATATLDDNCLFLLELEESTADPELRARIRAKRVVTGVAKRSMRKITDLPRCD